MSKELSIKKLETIAVDALEDIKGRDIIIVNTTKVSQMFERIVLASGESNRQVRALARSVADKVREAGGEVLSTEGEETGEWVLVDLGDMVVHIMQPAIRAYYRLEEIWGEKEVKFGAAKRAVGTARKAAQKAGDSGEKAAPAKKVAAKKTAAKKAPAKKASTKTAATKTTATKTDAEKAPAKKTAAKKAPAKKTAAR